MRHARRQQKGPAIPRRHKLAPSASFEQIKRARASSPALDEHDLATQPDYGLNVAPLAGSHYSLSQAHKDLNAAQYAKLQQQQKHGPAHANRRTRSISTDSTDMSDVSSIVSVSSLSTMEDFLTIRTKSPTRASPLERRASRRASQARRVRSPLHLVRFCARTEVVLNSFDSTQLSRQLSKRASLAVLASGSLLEGAPGPNSFTKPALSRRQSAFGLPIFDKDESQSQVRFGRRGGKEERV